VSNILFKKITQQNTIVLTANSRLARHLQSNFDQYQQSQKLIAWETPQILPLQSWLELQFYKTNKKDQLLLTDFQEECIWQEIISASKLDVLQPTQLVKLVKQACDILMQWNITLDILQPFSEQNEVRCLIEWISQFRQYCFEKNWITRAELPQLLQTQTLTLPKKIILIGFDDLNPVLKSLFEIIEKDISIETEFLTKNNIYKKQIILKNTDEEIKTAAKWLKMQWEKNPDKKFGCVIPDLEKMRTKVQRIFLEYFAIEQINLSAGIALSKHNMIYTALTALKWCYTDLPIQEVSALLQSPYLALNENEKNAGAQIDALLREKNKMQISIADVYSVIPKIQSRYPEITLLSRLRALINYYHEKKSVELLPSTWAQHFICALKIIEWPAHHTQNSAEFQVLERFKKVMHSFSQLDFIYPTLKYKRALQLLNSMTQQTLFQAKSHDEPIQIMGALEASGILFDSLWVMGLHDGAWPAASKPHPLIPYAIQQQHNMPHATAKRELQFCQHMTKRLENAAKQVIFSSPASEGDQQFFPSRLIQEIAVIKYSELLLSNELSIAEKIFQHKRIESCEDNVAPIISDFTNIHGGSNILKLQALCPFRAFATIRLKATALNQPVIGITPITKGILVHDVLHKIWGEINDHQLLNALTDESLTELIQSNIEKTFTEKDYQTHQPHNHYFFSLEKKRLLILIKNWLTLEKSRPYFRVQERETECNIQIKNLPIKIRLDRIDQLSDGSLFLIDYKTGLNNINGWFQERLTDPQLPLYAVFQANSQVSFSGIGFAQVKTGEMKLRGVIHEKHLYAENKTLGLIPVNKIKSEINFSWDILTDQWKKSLETLADDFCNGIANVDPMDETICKTCDLKPICRYVQC